MAGTIHYFWLDEGNSFMVRQRVFRDRANPLDCYDDIKLVQRFRFSRSSISRSTELIATHLNSTERSHAAPPHLQVCVSLQFFSCGTFKIVCGGVFTFVSLLLSLYSRCCTRITRHILPVRQHARFK